MISLIQIRIAYLKRHPCLLFWGYLFLPLIILLFGIYKLTKDKTIYVYQEKKDPEPINQEFLFFDDRNSYFKLFRYWDSTTFIVDQIENCDKIRNFFRDEFYLKDINCSIIESNYTQKTENIIKIKKEGKKYRVYLTTKEKNLTKSEPLNIDTIIDQMNETELNMIKDLFNNLNITHANDTKSFIEEIKNLNNLIPLT